MIGVYVAGASDPRERSRVRHVVSEIINMEGVKLTYDWLADVEAAGPDADLSPAQLREAAERCMRGVWDAHILLAIIPPRDVETRGMWWELGYSRRATSRVMVSVNGEPHCTGLPFLHLESVEKFLTDDAALSEIWTVANT